MGEDLGGLLFPPLSEPGFPREHEEPLNQPLCDLKPTRRRDCDRVDLNPSGLRERGNARGSSSTCQMARMSSGPFGCSVPSIF